MAGETVSSVHVDALLTNLARLYRPDEAGFIADRVVPRIPVVHESDLYAVFTQGDFYGTDVDDLVADKAEPRLVDFSHTTARYQTARRELGWEVSDRERKNADDQFRLERNKQVGTIGRLALKREIRVAALLRKTTNGGGLTLGANAAAKWDNSATTFKQMSTDVVTGKTAIRQAIGVSPNVIVIPAAVAEGMAKADIWATLQYTLGDTNDSPLISEAYPFLKQIMWGMRVLVPGLIQNTAAEGLAESYSDIWSEQVRMLYVTPGPDIENPSVAYTFQSEPLTTRTWREDKRRVDGYAVGQTIDERVVAPSAGYEINDCLT